MISIETKNGILSLNEKGIENFEKNFHMLSCWDNQLFEHRKQKDIYNMIRKNFPNIFEEILFKPLCNRGLHVKQLVLFHLLCNYPKLKSTFLRFDNDDIVNFLGYLTYNKTYRNYLKSINDLNLEAKTFLDFLGIDKIFSEHLRWNFAPYIDVVRRFSKLDIESKTWLNEHIGRNLIHYENLVNIYDELSCNFSVLEFLKFVERFREFECIDMHRATSYIKSYFTSLSKQDIADFDISKLLKIRNINFEKLIKSKRYKKETDAIEKILLNPTAENFRQYVEKIS